LDCKYFDLKYSVNWIDFNVLYYRFQDSLIWCIILFCHDSIKLNKPNVANQIFNVFLFSLIKSLLLSL
jgi:hypothetical protein